MRVLPRKDLRTEKGIDYSDAHLYRLIRDGKFPKPIKLGENRNAWVEEEIDRWLRERIEQREAA